MIHFILIAGLLLPVLVIIQYICTYIVSKMLELTSAFLDAGVDDGHPNDTRYVVHGIIHDLSSTERQADFRQTVPLTTWSVISLS